MKTRQKKKESSNQCTTVIPVAQVIPSIPTATQEVCLNLDVVTRGVYDFGVDNG